MANEDLIPHLFRTEYGKIVSVLCRRFGFEQIGMAEDIAGDTFLTAAQAWPVSGQPANPVAWLYQVARNKAVNQLKRHANFRDHIMPGLIAGTEISGETDIDLSPVNIQDSQLQMMFAICHPSIPPEAQIGLSLRILCGFGIGEIADAFLTSKETINKRLFRAKEKLREVRIKIEVPSADELDTRLDTVLTTIYLLFNEGYFSRSEDTGLRKDLCFEAIRLGYMLTENTQTNTPSLNALLALMCFHSSRFEARTDPYGIPVLYGDQDESKWDMELVRKGVEFMQYAARGNQLSRYHLEAGIAFWSTQKNDSAEKWDNVLQFYNRLLQIEYSPMAALNRTYALSKAYGKEMAIQEAEKLGLTGNPFYDMLLGELYSESDKEKARQHFQKARALLKTASARLTIQRKIENL